MKAADIGLLDDSLATLSVRVAQEIDRRLSGKHYNRSVLKRWGEHLSRASGVNNPNPAALLGGDPTTTEILAQAIEHSQPEPIADIEHLVAAVKEIIVPLTVANDDLSDATLSAVKSFSLALHRSLMTHDLPSWREREDASQDEFRLP